ncbi:MAG: DMT family transporter [Pseudomonadota bacterium]
MYTGFFLAIFGTLLFSLKSIFIKLIYLQGLDADTVLVMRMALALPLYVIILIKLLKKSHSKYKLIKLPVISKILILGFLGYYLASLLDLMGLEYISAQLERLSLFTYPFMVAIIGFLFFNEKITKRLIFSLVICYAGLWLVIGQEAKLSENNVLLGTGLVLGAALSFSLYVLFSRALIKQVGSVFFTCLAMISSSLIVFVHGTIFIQFSALEISWVAWFWLLLLAVFSTVIPSFMLTEAIHRIGPTQTGVVGTLGPIFTIGLAVFVLNEPFTLTIFLGILMVIIGVSLIVIKR